MSIKIINLKVIVYDFILNYTMGALPAVVCRSDLAFFIISGHRDTANLLIDSISSFTSYSCFYFSFDVSGKYSASQREDSKTGSS